MTTSEVDVRTGPEPEPFEPVPLSVVRPDASGEVVGASEQRPSLSVLITIRAAMPALRPAEQRVAEAVLADPAGVSEGSITAVARLGQTSETTVLRFCRAIGLAGYPELRIALARAAQGEEHERALGTPPSSVITASDSLADVVTKVAYADAAAVADTGAALDHVALERAVIALTAARRIDIYGVGASALVGHELHQKLHRIGLVTCVWPDPHAALASASGLGVGDVAIGISHTGTTIDILDPLRVARSRGAGTIAITNYGRAPIVRFSDIVLTTAARETTFRAGAMVSRVPQLVLVDCLFAAVAQRSFDRSIAALDASRAVLETRHDGRRLS